MCIFPPQEKHDESFSQNKWLADENVREEIDRDNVKTKMEKENQFILRKKRAKGRRKKFQREYDEKDYDFDERGENKSFF